MNSRSLISTGLVALFVGGIEGCSKNEPPKPEPAASATSAEASPRSKLNVRTPIGVNAKFDPQAMKDYRADICYYGTLSLRQARDSYLASLGKDEPSEKKIPNFGVPDPSASGAAGTKAGPAPRPSTAASASASAGKSLAPPPRPFDFSFRAPHERNARACSAAFLLKEPAMGDVDAALGSFAPFAVELAKDIASASSYYQREEYKKDSFAKGKELHKKLLEEFAKLDELEDKLGTALFAWRKAHPANPTKMEEGEKVAHDTLEDASSVVHVLTEKKIDLASYKANVDKLDKSVEALKAFSASHAGDTWTKMLSAPFEAFLKVAKEAKLTEKGANTESYLGLATSFTGLIEGRQRALQRAMLAKGQAANAAPSAAAPAPSGRPEATPP